METDTTVTQPSSPETGDYLTGGVPRAIYLVAYSDGFRVRAIAVDVHQRLRRLEGTWPQLLCDGFRLHRHDDIQENRTRLIVLLATTVVLAALTFGLASPLSFLQLVSMSGSLAVGYVACTIVNGFKRDFYLRRQLLVENAAGVRTDTDQ
jgi:hypothetical protein